ncbi:MAG: glutamine-hydrolyzing GMP synthase [Alphaproteobacteria bacterium]|nr:glutamine-hydrolyzing GMP synthase [Alphaproteobacteria bacterium]
MEQQAQIIILDFGSQYSHVIARKVRDLGVYCEIVPFNISLDKIKAKNPKGIIFSGGPQSVYDKDALLISKEYFDLNIPILGICYGMQLITHLLGGSVKSHGKEYGKAILNILEESKLLASIPDSCQVWMSHGDAVVDLPSGFKTVAKSGNVNAVMENSQKNIYGVQFHPEVSHSIYGEQLLANFLFNISNCQKDWSMESYVDKTIKEIQEIVGDKKVVLGLSGGVDSSVAALLIHKAIGDKLLCVFVDTGLLRLNECNEVKATYSKEAGLNVSYIDASTAFFKALSGVADPEAKRKIIGKEFIEVFHKTIESLEDVDFLAQGTIYPDIIESSSSSGASKVIKSHHNVGGLPEHMKLQLLEPLKYLFKDEVRKLGKILGLSESIVNRHPFPGPGLGIRVVGEVIPEKVAILQKADSIFLEELRKENLYNKVSQAFAVLLPVKSVGVMGDNRSYEWTAVLRSVSTTDFMTAEVSRIPFEILEKVALRIVNEVEGINRVLYDFTGKPPSTIEWE